MDQLFQYYSISEKRPGCKRRRDPHPFPARTGAAAPFPGDPLPSMTGRLHPVSIRFLFLDLPAFGRLPRPAGPQYTAGPDRPPGTSDDFLMADSQTSATAKAASRLLGKARCRSTILLAPVGRNGSVNDHFPRQRSYMQMGCGASSFFLRLLAKSIHPASPLPTYPAGSLRASLPLHPVWPR